MYKLTSAPNLNGTSSILGFELDKKDKYFGDIVISPKKAPFNIIYSQGAFKILFLSSFKLKISLAISKV